jgi:hypothetical protein
MPVSPLTGLGVDENGAAINIPPLRGFLGKPLTVYRHLPTAYCSAYFPLTTAYC